MAYIEITKTVRIFTSNIRDIYLDKENPSNSFYIFSLNMNFENLTVRLHVLCALNMRVKFRSNRMLFTIRSIKLFFIHNFLSQNLKFKNVIDDIAIKL